MTDRGFGFQDHTSQAPFGLSFYLALLAVAAIVNGAGYLFNLWHEETIFDEAVHFYTAFAVIAALGWLVRPKGLLSRGFRFGALLVLVGIGLGLSWEVFEWAIGIVGGRRDTLVDLFADSIGAATAAALLSAR